MKKLLVRLLLFLFVVLALLYFVRNYLITHAVEIGVKTQTGFPLQIGALDFGSIGGTLEVRELKLTNPREFEEKRFVDLPLFKADYDTVSMLRGTPHIKELVVNVNEIVIVTNPEGKTNAQVFQDKLVPASPKESGTPKPADTKKKQYRLDLVRVHVGTVILRDYSKGQPTEKKIALNQDVTLKDVTETSDIPTLVMRTVFGSINNFIPGGMKGLGASFSETEKSLEKSSKGWFDSMKKAVPK